LRFTYLSLILAGPDRNANAVGTIVNPSAGSLLVVDDSEVNRNALAQLLRAHGFAITVARGGRHALDLVTRQSFDLVILDVMMQDLNGLEVLSSLRETLAATALPVIMATARDQSEDIVRALELGANDYVTKPLDFPVLLARIHTQLSLKEAVGRIVRLEQKLAQRNQQLEAANEQLTAANEQMKGDLEAAAHIQEAFLPQVLPRSPAADFAWMYKPCADLAGDTLNIFALDDRHVGLYVLDVSGHGVAASLLAVTLSHVLAPRPDPASLVMHGGRSPVPPREVVTHLSRRFTWDPASEQFFTIVYGILNLETGELRYVSAGHPGPVYLARQARPAILQGPSLPIGLGEACYQEQSLTLRLGERLYFYSDGLIDAMNPDHTPFGKERLEDALDRHRHAPLRDSLAALWQDVVGWCGTCSLRDDISILAVEFTGSPRHHDGAARVEMPAGLSIASV
jgi:sigma-B regulation protein RsbU (phosphoserine phosphatase)